MRATLEFDLPDEIEEFETACKASKLRQALYDVYNELFREPRKYRGYGAYENEAIEQQVVTYAETLEDKFHIILKEYEIEI